MEHEGAEKGSDRYIKAGGRRPKDGKERSKHHPPSSQLCCAAASRKFPTLSRLNTQNPLSALIKHNTILSSTATMANPDMSVFGPRGWICCKCSLHNNNLQAASDCCKNCAHESARCTSCTRLGRGRNTTSVPGGPSWGRGWFWASPGHERPTMTSQSIASKGTAHQRPSSTSTTTLSAAAPALKAAPTQTGTPTTVTKSAPAVVAAVGASSANNQDNTTSRRRTSAMASCNVHDCDSYSCNFHHHGCNHHDGCSHHHGSNHHGSNRYHSRMCMSFGCSDYFCECCSSCAWGCAGRRRHNRERSQAAAQAMKTWLETDPALWKNLVAGAPVLMVVGFVIYAICFVIYEKLTK